MEQFSLDKYLENTSRKVVTRDGRSVRILDYNLKGDKRICIAADDKTQESITTVDENGHCLIDKTSWHESNFDLFFADDEELTEFQNKLFSVMSEVWQNYLLGREIDFAETIKEYLPELLDLARKEIEATGWKDSMRKYKEAYEQGKQDALKDLPKWKKATEQKDFNYHVARLEDNRRVVIISEVLKGDYYIELNDLKTLPKEE